AIRMPGRGSCRDSEIARPKFQIPTLGHAVPCPYRARQAVEYLDGGVPADAAVGDRLTVDQGAGGISTEILAAGDQERFEHHPADCPVAGGDLAGPRRRPPRLP